METTQIAEQTTFKFNCECCKYYTNRKADMNRHNSSKRHQINSGIISEEVKEQKPRREKKEKKTNEVVTQIQYIFDEDLKNKYESEITQLKEQLAQVIKEKEELHEKYEEMEYSRDMLQEKLDEINQPEQSPIIMEIKEIEEQLESDDESITSCSEADEEEFDPKYGYWSEPESDNESESESEDESDDEEMDKYPAGYNPNDEIVIKYDIKPEEFHRFKGKAIEDIEQMRENDKEREKERIKNKHNNVEDIPIENVDVTYEIYEPNTDDAFNLKAFETLCNDPQYNSYIINDSDGKTYLKHLNNSWYQTDSNEFYKDMVMKIINKIPRSKCPIKVINKKERKYLVSYEGNWCIMSKYAFKEIIHKMSISLQHSYIKALGNTITFGKLNKSISIIENGKLTTGKFSQIYKIDYNTFTSEAGSQSEIVNVIYCPSKTEKNDKGSSTFDIYCKSLMSLMSDTFETIKIEAKNKKNKNDPMTALLNNPNLMATLLASLIESKK